MTTKEPDAGAEEDLVRLVVDTESCIGGGQCEMLEPGTFLVGDDDGLASVVGTGLLPRPRALNVIDRCPGQAITLAESSTG